MLVGIFSCKAIESNIAPGSVDGRTDKSNNGTMVWTARDHIDSGSRRRLGGRLGFELSKSQVGEKQKVISAYLFRQRVVCGLRRLRLLDSVAMGHDGK